MLSRRELIKEHESIVKELASIEKKLRGLRMEQEEELAEMIEMGKTGPHKSATKRETRRKNGTTKPGTNSNHKKRARKRKQQRGVSW
jgi:hypothetical protein